jgi:hypothetical protein
MADVLPARIPPEAPRPFLQFGLGTLFWITTATAVVCAVVFRMPIEFAIPLIVFISVALPAVLTTVIIYGRSYQRTFCIGAMFPSVLLPLIILSGGMNVTLFHPNLNEYEAFPFRMTVCAFWASSLLIGGLCVGVRRLVERRPASPPELGNTGPGTRTAIAAMTDLLKDKVAR